MVPGEDPMELSTDMEKRFLGDEDIDIDLSLDGRSPYAQEDDDMLEDSHFAEDQRLCDDQRECNDDEMADVTEATDDMDKIQEGRHGENAQDLDEFDILVDDEEIEDVEDTVIFSDDTTGLPSTFPYQVGEVLEQQRHNQFSEQSYSNHANGTYGEVPHPNEIESQSVDFMQAYVAESAQDTRIFTTAEQADPTGHRTAMPDQKFFQEQVNPSQMAEDDFVGNSTDTILEDVSTVQALVSVQEEVEGEHERHDDRSNGSSSHNQLQGSSSDRASRDREELPEQTLPKDPSDSDPQIGVQSQKEEAFHHIPDANGTETVAIDTAVEVLAEQGKDSAPQETSSIHDRTLLHPVIVVYQESEILLFPPHEHGEDQAQTYFLKDESLATQTIESLLGACRLVLADSIDDDDELELKFTSLGLDICETSNAAITTTLAQILDIYLKLQHNDGLDYPDPLQMTLTTKLSFSHRFEYLHSAAAGGVGFLDVAQSSKAKYKYMEEHEDGNEYGGDDPQEKAESFRSDVDEAIEEGDRLTGAHDGVVTDFQTPDAGTKYSEELNLAEPVLEPTSHDHTLNEEGRQPQIEKVPRPDNTGQGINTQLQQDEINTIGDPVHHSFEHTEPFQDDFAARIENKDRGEGNRAFSPSSSTLRGDESDVAGEHDRSSLASVPLPPSDDFYSAPQENETGGAFHDIADPEQPELSDQTSENDGDIFDLEDLEDIDQAQEADQDHATKQDHGASDLPADMNHLSNEGDYEVQNGLTTSSLSKEASKGNSDIDDDEITYDDEDAEDSIRANHGDVEGTNRPGNSPRPESNHEGIDHENGTSGGQRESLKRLRPEKDEEPAQGDDTQELKRVRSE